MLHQRQDLARPHTYKRQDLMEKKDIKIPLSHRPFKRADYYENIEEAKKGLVGSPEAIERMAKARLEAQRTAELIRKEKDF